MGEFFGTDGIRGVANKDLTPELAYRLGRAAGYVLTKQLELDQSQLDQSQDKLVLIGKDTRLSSDMLEGALAAGFMSVGVNVMRLGVIPTPGVAYLITHYNAMAGAMISASHNPYQDNGIKIFNNKGFKLSEAMEQEVESYLSNEQLFLEIPRSTHGDIGCFVDDFNGPDLYKEHLMSTISIPLIGMKIILDCANGAATEYAPGIFQELGAEVCCLSINPDGTNINNKCGSTHLDELRKQVVEQHADLGLAFDGDADRLIAVDHLGEVVDGDYILTICGIDLKEQGKLVDDTIVTTVMANMGFFVAMQDQDINTLQTKVGDKYVLEEMVKGGYTLGGEQSGHIIFLDYAKTGDGILTALHLTDLVARRKTSLHELCGQMVKYPQLLVNVRVVDKEGLHSNQKIADVIQQNEQKLGNQGRVLVRPSGTEALVRVMAEGPNEEVLEEVVNNIVEVVKEELT
ncbi:phosphoglucosamine mutase [Desulfuribacillus alkaliarsenatis]|uniref:Phosphoglucosamine mutase n=1 Tax=Desulfuribacillus alkaliarsenatis TaxID=766136 RepID=A0A1E5G3K1_9FIRM|nr:phosphoglucosamine mutase [Desulfuribacillus alkaliarsenatis]OEF97668.1 phosphoglucosamine mutase [Desulfuribacillus alkaliarsenatis]